MEQQIEQTAFGSRCSQTKREARGLLPAIDRYDGSSYRVLRSYLREREWPSNLSVAILSARYGLVGGITGIEHYVEWMTSSRASELAPQCVHTLSAWAEVHNSVHFSLGKDYLPAVTPAIEKNLRDKAEIFEGGIGMKLSQIKGLLERTEAPTRHRPQLPEPGSGKVTYFLPDWDDLLDGYRHLAIGGLVPLPDALVEEIVAKVMAVVATLKPRPWVHLFGVFRPKLQAKFKEYKVDSFDSASYFRKAWLRSDQNYLASNGKWYAALRVPMTSDGRTRKKLEQSGLDLASLEAQEAQVIKLLCQFDRDQVGVQEVLNAVIEYDERLTRTSDVRSLRSTYERTLRDRPWRTCDCPFCKQAGIHVLIFRGTNRNKRRGAHNTLMLYGSLGKEG